MKKLIRVAQTFVHFGLGYRNSYQAFINFDATRIDIPETKWELNVMRLTLFNLLKRAVAQNFPEWNEERSLNLAE